MVEREIFNVSQTLAQIEDVNLATWSEVKRAGTPKHEIQLEIKACAQDSADMEVNGVASGQRYVRPIIINMKNWPEAEGSGPTRSM